MKSTLAAAALIVAALGIGSAATTTHQPATGHRQVSARIAPNDLGWGGAPATPNDLGWGSGSTPLSA